MGENAPLEFVAKRAGWTITHDPLRRRIELANPLFP